jgi:hypothetical protein
VLEAKPLNAELPAQRDQGLGTRICDRAIGRSTRPGTDGQVEGGLDIRKHSRPWLTGREGPVPAAVAVPRQALAARLSFTRLGR